MAVEMLGINTPAVPPLRVRCREAYDPSGCYTESPAAQITTNPKDTVGALKAPLHLIPAAADILESQVLALGARKYGAFNWRTTNPVASIYVSAARRHLAAWFDGEDADPESGVSHLAHARACLSIMLDSIALGRLIIDRPPVGSASTLLAASMRPLPDSTEIE